MNETVDKLNEIVDEFVVKIGKFSESELAERPLPHKWSKKEVVGHLIDSGQNNLRRFIISQYEPTPPKIAYDQEFWVKANNYQQMNGKDVIELWRLVNFQIASVLSKMNQKSYDRLCDTAMEKEQLRSLKWLASDYVKHMKHHLNQVIKGSFNVVYP